MKSWILAEFTSTDGLVTASRKMREEGYRRLDSYTPYPVHGVDEAMGWGPSKVPFIAAAAAITGCTVGYMMQFGLNGIVWPINVANRPMNSAPAFIPVTFEMTILFTAFALFLSVFI